MEVRLSMASHRPFTRGALLLFAVLATLAIVFGLVIIFGAIFKPSIFGKHPATRN